jgi:hypothetical protein
VEAQTKMVTLPIQYSDDAKAFQTTVYTGTQLAESKNVSLYFANVDMVIAGTQCTNCLNPKYNRLDSKNSSDIASKDDMPEDRDDFIYDDVILSGEYISDFMCLDAAGEYCSQASFEFFYVNTTQVNMDHSNGLLPIYPFNQ